MTTKLMKNVIDSIEELYAVFSVYTLPEAGIQTCLDFGPSEEEAAAFALPLREISYQIIRGAEFYDTTWNSWGNEAEVKYLLPRIFETFVDELVTSSAVNIDAFSKLIRFKMLDLYTEASKWTVQERASIKHFFLSLFEYLANEPNMVEAFIDYLGLMTVVFEDMNTLTAIWDKVPDPLQSIQIQHWVVTYMNPETLELGEDPILTVDSAKARVGGNLDSLKQWVLTEEHIINSMDFFSDEPWFNLALGMKTKLK